MEATVIIIAVIVVAVIAALAVFASRRRTAAKAEEARYHATETRNLAEVSRLEADAQAAVG